MDHVPRTPPEGPLAAGSRLGPYEIVAPLGAGGMGEVYRARDTRLRRDVAIKVIRPSLVRPAYIERLGREARAAAALSHPNILAVYDVNIDGPTPYVVSELLEGESLRTRMLRGPLPYRKALDYGIQIAVALSAAHAKRILHRDVKPGNVFLTDDGHVKLLDFGLAKLQTPETTVDTGGSTASDPTQTVATDPSRPGHVIGTVGYMAPEQALGEPLDHRADIFSLGTVLYEMLSGKRPFHRSTPSESMRAVLSSDPEDLLSLNPSLPPAAVAVVRRCLEKNRDERFQSTRDLAFHLRQLAQPSSDTHPPAPAPTPRPRLALVGIGLALALAFGVVYSPPWVPAPAAPSFRQLTYHRGWIGGARFAGQDVVYSRAVGFEEPEVWLRIAASPESRPLGYTGTVLATRAGQVALLIDGRFGGGKRFVGTLAVAPLGGGAPSRMLENVVDADWDETTGQFLVSRSLGLGAGSDLEYPVGSLLHRSPGAILHPRLSPDGTRVAFLDDPAGVGTGGHVVLMDREGEEMHRTRFWPRARGIAWSADGDEVWFTAGEGRANRALRAVTPGGAERMVHEAPGSLTILDVADDGRVLLNREDERMAMVGTAPGGTSEQELSWFDDAGVASLSRDGHTLLFGDRFGIYVRPTDGSPASKLMAEGWADELSPDGRFALTTSQSGDRVILVPTGPGQARPLDIPGIEAFNGSLWLTDGKRIVVNGREPNRRIRSYVVETAGGPPRAVTDEGDWALSVSPDGQRLASTSHDHGIYVWPVAGGRPSEVPGSLPGDRPMAWSADGSFLWVFRRDEVPARVLQVDVATGDRRVWRTLSPPDVAGIYSIEAFTITPSGDAYFYSYQQILSELYEAVDLR